MYCRWKDNWEESKHHYTQWWKGEGLVVANWGGGVSMESPLRPVDMPAPACSPRQRHTDPQWIAANENYKQACISSPLDMLPIAFPDIGTVSLAAILGAIPKLADDNIWYECDPGFGPDSDRILEFDRDSEWWKIISGATRAVKAMSNGNYFTGCPAVSPNLDVLAEIRGTQDLMMDLILAPEWVHRKLDEIQSAFESVYTELYNIIREGDGSSVMGYFMVWAPGTVCLGQCDTAAMISQDMFEEFVVPYLRRQCDFQDYSIYHVDGPMALQTVDSILEIESLNAVEFTPGPNLPDGGDPHWWDLYRKIKKAGKSVQVVGVKPEEVVPLIDAIGPEGTCVHVWCDDLDQHVDELKKISERYKI